MTNLEAVKLKLEELQLRSRNSQDGDDCDALEQQKSPSSTWRWLADHPEDAAELAELLHEAAPTLSLEALSSYRKHTPSSRAQHDIARSQTLELTTGIKERILAAEPISTSPGCIDWSKLCAAVSSDVLKFSNPASPEDGTPTAGQGQGQGMSWEQGTLVVPTTPGSLVEVTSGGRVLFCLFEPDISPAGHAPTPPVTRHATPHNSFMKDSSTQDQKDSHLSSFTSSSSIREKVHQWGASSSSSSSNEGCLVLKFVPSRLLCQSEQFASELAQHVGVCAPDSRIVRMDGHDGQAEWDDALNAAERIAARFPELHDEMTRSACMLLLEYVPGHCLLTASDAFRPGPVALRTFADLGRLLALDMLLGNSDRLRCEALGWRGNDGNAMCGNRGRFEGRVVAIDAVVQRRPPGALLSAEDAACEKLVELALNDPGVAEATLEEAIGGSGAAKEALAADTDGAVGAFRAGLRAGLDATMGLKGLLEMMFQQVGDWIDAFIDDIEGSYTLREPPSAGRRVGSAGAAPSHSSSAGGGGGAAGGAPLPSSPSYTTFKIRQINHEAARNRSVSEKVTHWKDVFKARGDDLRAAVEEWQVKKAGGDLASPRSGGLPRLTTGFLDGTHVVVDIYELKVRLEHMLQRLRVLQQATATARPTRLLPGLFVSGAVEANSFHTLRHLGITHVLNATEDLLLPDEGHCFECIRVPLCDKEEENIRPHLPQATEFIDVAMAEGGKILVHCHAGQSRSCTIILAWMMTRRKWTLRRAIDELHKHRPQAAPNAGYMQALAALEEELFGAQTVKVKKTKPEPKKCPICGDKVGLSAESVKIHLRLKHAGQANQFLSMSRPESSASSH